VIGLEMEAAGDGGENGQGRVGPFVRVVDMGFVLVV